VPVVRGSGGTAPAILSVASPRQARSCAALLAPSCPVTAPKLSPPWRPVPLRLSGGGGPLQVESDLEEGCEAEGWRKPHFAGCLRFMSPHNVFCHFAP